MNSPELQLQAKIARQLEVMQALGKIDWFTAIVNETYTQSWNQKRKNKLAGLKKGLCDLFLIVNGKTYFIELKSPTGYLSEAQVEVLKHLNKKGEIKGFVCKSFESWHGFNLTCKT